MTRPRPFRFGDLAMMLATWFGAGRLPWAPGTWGSLAALPFAWGIAEFGGRTALLGAVAIVFFVGWAAATGAARASRSSDPGWIVIDEVAGQWLTLAVAPLDPLAYVLGFALFRAMDILKPWPVSLADRHVPGGFGIMLDDMLAGLYAAAALAGLLWGLDHVR
jgi:phosphatidylglycerophosphatase A